MAMSRFSVCASYLFCEKASVLLFRKAHKLDDFLYYHDLEVNEAFKPKVVFWYHFSSKNVIEVAYQAPALKSMYCMYIYNL